MKKHYRHEHDCLNCGSELRGKYCHNCGQENLEIKESFGHMMTHAISDYFHFDHQFFHTLKPLLFKPGKLTIDYMAGRRAQYLHPVKMYIFISLVYFVLLFKSGHDAKEEVKHERAGEKKEQTETNKKEAAGKVNKTNAAPDAETKKHAAAANGLKIATTKNKPVIDIGGFDDPVGNVKQEDSTYAQYEASEAKRPADERDGFWEKFYNKSKYRYEEKYGKERAKEMFMEDLKHNVPKMMFILLPLFALILKLAFWRNKKYYVEHLIYAIHLHCFFFLLYTIIILVTMPLPENLENVSGWLGGFAFFATVWYIYRSLRVVYHRSRWRTISKIIGMSFMYLFAFTFCMCCLLLLTAAMA